MTKILVFLGATVLEINKTLCLRYSSFIGGVEVLEALFVLILSAADYPGLLALVRLVEEGCLILGAVIIPQVKALLAVQAKLLGTTLVV